YGLLPLGLASASLSHFRAGAAHSPADERGRRMARALAGDRIDALRRCRPRVPSPGGPSGSLERLREPAVLLRAVDRVPDRGAGEAELLGHLGGVPDLAVEV